MIDDFIEAGKVSLIIGAGFLLFLVVMLFLSGDYWVSFRALISLFFTVSIYKFLDKIFK